MVLSPRHGVFIGIICLLLLAPRLLSAALDPKALDQTINVNLRDTSMSDAVAMVASASDLPIIAPGEPSKGIMVTLNNQTVRQVLDGLAAASGTKWVEQDDMIVFSKVPETPDKAKPTPPKHLGPLTPEQGMAEMISSLNSGQLYALSSGGQMGYPDMSTYQQDILRAMLSAPTVGVTESGEIIKDLPKPQQAIISFATLPYLTVPDAAGKGTELLRLDTTPYINLKGNAK